MRVLTVQEARQVAGGLVVTPLDPVNVTGYPSDPYDLSGGGSVSAPSTGGGSVVTVGGGGSSSGSVSAYQSGAYKFTTPNGHKYSLGMRISATQAANLDAIVDYGYSIGATASEIQIAASQAYYESSFGTLETNSASNATGLYQYMPTTWSETHSDLNINSDSDQTKALYQDISTFEARYASGEASGAIPSTINFGEYFEVKHHLGSNSTSWTDPVVTQYNDRSLILGFNAGG